MLSAADGLGPGSQTRHAGTRAGGSADHAETPRHGQLLANADHDRRHRQWPWRAQALSQIHDLLGRGIPPTDAIRSTEYTTALRDTGTGPVPATQ